MTHTDAQPPTPTLPAEDPNQVYFARPDKSGADYSANLKHRRGLAWRVATAIPFLALLVSGLLLNKLGMPSKLLLTLALALVVPFILVLVIASLVPRLRRRRFTRTFHGKLPPAATLNVRLVCVGDPATWSDQGPISDASFEPTIFRGGFGLWPNSITNSTRTMAVAMLLIWSGLIALQSLYFGRLNPGTWGLYASVAIVAAESLRAFLWPIYLRLVPGRLDVMHFSAFGRRVRKLERVPLRDAKILINLIDRYAIIDAADKRHELSLLLMREYKNFAHTLFLAAISTYTPPPLPDDDLLG